MTRKTVVAISVVLMIVCVAVFVIYSRAHPPYKPPPVAFSGDSTTAKQTVVVPTLDTPMPKGRNVIWCGTIQLCWDGLKALPGLQLPSDTDAARRISAAKMNPSDLPLNEYYTAAGRIKDGIVQKIQTDMAARFPKVKPDVGPPPDPETIALAYAYLAAQVKFTTPYFDREKGDDFTDSAGNKMHVRTFGMFHDPDADINRTLAQQVSLLYRKDKDYRPVEFALDLDKNSQPSQLILARMAPGETLATTWKDLQEKIKQWQPPEDHSGQPPYTQYAHLVVPDLNFRINHRFKELESNLHILRAQQSIEFRLDKSGAVAGSEASIHAEAAAEMYEFTGPFLIVMRKRGATEPYFVMWVDNAELLCKQNAK